MQDDNKSPTINLAEILDQVFHDDEPITPPEDGLDQVDNAIAKDEAQHVVHGACGMDTQLSERVVNPDTAKGKG